MRLNLPFLHLLENSQHILIAGAGGGFDIYAGLPIYFELKAAGKQVSLANYSFTDFPLAKAISNPVEEIETLLLGARGKLRIDTPYFPEGHLAQWFLETSGEEVIVWMFDDRGVLPLQNAYEHLIQKLGIDALILVDGGVDSLMCGDESAPGTLLEDSITLGAVAKLNLPVKILASLGFGTEVEEGVSHYLALENMAVLTKAGAFLGSCALAPQMPAFQQYEAACRYAWESSTVERHRSHISTRIIPAVHGEFGNYHMYADKQQYHMLSPLMGLYWFFQADTVIEHSLVIPMIAETYTKQDAFEIYAKWAMSKWRHLRPKRRLPY